ncbi:MAG: glycosyltransferase [Planctomycetes bacterium]|nr:glycosyltransferase [Planctomycetota bacterium]
MASCNAHYRAYFDALAPEREKWRRRNLGYYLELERQYRFVVPPGARVLEVGCGLGELLAALEPAQGVGVDLSEQMIRRAKEKFPGKNLRFVAGSIEDFCKDAQGATFDYIVLSDVLGFLYDIAAVFESLKAVSHPRTRLIMNFHSRVWQPFFNLAETLHLKTRHPAISWVTPDDVAGLLALRGFEVVRRYHRILMPKRFPLVSRFCNRFLASLWPFRSLCVSNFMVARFPAPAFKEPPVVTVVVPCRNEAGNIAQIVERLPHMGARTELIFVEGNSTDDTYARCLEARDKHPEMGIQVYKQSGKGKGDAVRLGFSKASGEVLMILDADITVAPEDLPHFYEALATGRVEFVNGSRLVYPMEEKAMRFLNLCANKFFGMAFTFLIEQQVKDTLCGTKVLTKADYEKIIAGRRYFGDFDPFGDFDLLFGAAKLNLKVQDLPIRYRDRTYGTTNISRFRHGWLLLRMCFYAFRRLKCH